MKCKIVIICSIVNIIGDNSYTEPREDILGCSIISITELGLSESMSTLIFYMCGGMYASFSGEAVDNIHVDFVNEETGEVIQSADSKNLGN